MMKETVPLVKPLVNSAIKPPADFQWVWNDKYNGGDKDISFWRVIPQPGYVAIGDAHRCLDYRVAIDIVGSIFGDILIYSRSMMFVSVLMYYKH